MSTVAIPIYTTIQQEKEVLHERSVFSLHLFNELQLKLGEEEITNDQTFKKNINKQEATFSFTTEGAYVKGCVNWKNAKEREEKRCLYGIWPV